VSLSKDLARKARELVDRGRHGDQNALALLENMGSNARAGLPAAQEPYKVVLEYARKTSPADMGAFPSVPDVPDRVLQGMSCLRDPNCPPPVVLRTLCDLLPYAQTGAVECACVLLCDCRPVDEKLIAAVQQCLSGQSRPSFQEGIARAGSGDELRKTISAGAEPAAVLAGHALGVARRWQAVKMGAPLSFLSEDVSWELEGDQDS
jgi:hypothetical protein